jgi:ubiquitin-conjugating enzyme E2 Z
MSQVISKETISRLIKDIKNIIKNPLIDQGIYYIHDETDMMKGYAMIVGQIETPYFGGFYFFEIKYPYDYPYSPPMVKYCTNGNNIRFNPNLYTCGKVCISLLNTWKGEQWTSCQSISTILLTLCTLLCNNPLLNEPGVNKNHRDIEPYNQIIQYSNFNIAICDIVSKKNNIYMDFFELFYPFIKENFNKNYDKLIEIATQKLNEISEPTKFNTLYYYGINIIIDYDYIIKKLKSTKQLLNIT